RASADPAPAPAIQPPAESKQVQVIRTNCEARLRIGSDLLFDFDRHAVRAEALAVLDEVKRLLGTQDATVEGHTDGKGTDSYNQALSERRA
ncbi:OmpA family protein, partial [Klebsiella pneumoniae]|uniref:OmpA family protein n=1 Tax=Klebsiella pneumoniae TaxID=573 RepID=UPI0038538CF7